MAIKANGTAKIAECVAARSDSTPALPSRSGRKSAGSVAMSAGVITKATVATPAMRHATMKPKTTRTNALSMLAPTRPI
jgi:hypothetical protein